MEDQALLMQEERLRKLIRETMCEALKAGVPCVLGLTADEAEYLSRQVSTMEEVGALEMRRNHEFILYTRNNGGYESWNFLASLRGATTSFWKQAIACFAKIVITATVASIGIGALVMLAKEFGDRLPRQ